MEQPYLDIELVQPNMLRMIRSARSRLNRDHSVDDASVSTVLCDKGIIDGCPPQRTVSGAPSPGAAPCRTLSGAHLGTGVPLSRWRELKVVDSCDAPPDRPLKRTSGNRSILGGGRQRLTRSRSTVDQVLAVRASGSENAPPVVNMAHCCTASTAVLSDVTNTTGLACQPCLRSTACAKPAAPQREKGPSPYPGTSDLQSKLQGCNIGGSVAPSVRTSTPSEAEATEADALNAEDPQHVVEYIPDIYRTLQKEEGLLLPQPTYMDKQPHINSKMRGILVDWLVDVHKKYKLRPETLFLAIALLDRFLEKRVTGRRHLQLVGVSGLLIAAKFEELCPPQINEFVYVTDRAYTKEEVIKMEVSMLTALEFKVCRPTAAHFLDRYVRINGCSETHRHLAAYILELTLTEYNMVKYTPSHLAAAAILLSNKLCKRDPAWTPAAVKHTKMSEPMLKECAKEMCTIYEHAERSHLQAVRKKYSQQKFLSVAKMSFPFTTGPDPAEEATRAKVRRPSALRRGSAPAAPMEALSQSTTTPRPLPGQVGHYVPVPPCMPADTDNHHRHRRVSAGEFASGTGGVGVRSMHEDPEHMDFAVA